MLSRATYAGALCLLSALASSANVLTIPLTTVVDTSPDVGGTLTLPQFNSSLGTLTGVTLNFANGSISADVNLSDFETIGGPINISYTLGYQVSFALPVGGPFVPTAEQTLVCSANAPEETVCGVSGTPATNPTSGSFDLSADIPAFLAGTVGVNYTPSIINQEVFSTPANPSNLTASVTNESLTQPASITFTYDAAGAPEPSTFALLGIGAIALAGWKLNGSRRAACAR